MSYKRCQDLEGTVPLSTRPTWSEWTSGTTSSSATWAGGALTVTNPSNSSSSSPPATFSSSSEWRLFYVTLTSRFSLDAFGSNLTARCVVSFTLSSLCNRKTMANMIPLTGKKQFYLSFRTKGVEAERKSWRGIGLDGSLAGKVDCDSQSWSVCYDYFCQPRLWLWLFLKQFSVQYLQKCIF